MNNKAFFSLFFLLLLTFLHGQKMEFKAPDYVEIQKNIEDKVSIGVSFPQYIYEEKGDFNKALTYYQNILDNHKDGIYKDEALYFSAEIYRKHLLDNEKAKALYEKVVLEHPDSLYYTESRKQYRTLRGDSTI